MKFYNLLIWLLILPLVNADILKVDTTESLPINISLNGTSILINYGQNGSYLIANSNSTNTTISSTSFIFPFSREIVIPNTTGVVVNISNISLSPATIDFINQSLTSRLTEFQSACTSNISQISNALTICQSDKDYCKNTELLQMESRLANINGSVSGLQSEVNICERNSNVLFIGLLVLLLLIVGVIARSQGWSLRGRLSRKISYVKPEFDERLK